MIKNIILLLFMICIISMCQSCGFKVKADIPDSNQTVKVDATPDFERIAAFCDDRYDGDSKEAEACFKDFRNYFDINIGVNLDNIINYCESSYELPQDITGCKKELLIFMSSVNQK